MSLQQFSNNFRTTLASSAQATDTTLTLAGGSGAKLPDLSNNKYCLLTLEASGTIEIVKVTGKSGDVISVTRGYENYPAAFFPSGSSVEGRVTAGTLSAFLRNDDTLVPTTSLSQLVAPSAAQYPTSICREMDDGGNPIVCISDTVTDVWRFSTHKRALTTGATVSVGVNTPTSITSGSAGALSSVTPGKYVIQFTNGLNKGLPRLVTMASSNTIQWSVALPNTPLVGDVFTLYKSDVSILTEADSVGDEALAYVIALS